MSKTNRSYRLAFLALLAWTGTAGAQKSAPPVSSSKLLQRADSLAGAAQYEAARVSYGQVLETPAASDHERAAAYFGRALLEQRALQQTRSLPSGDALGHVRSDYEKASKLDSAKYYPYATNNVALMLLDNGQAQDALVLLRNVLRSTNDKGAVYHANVGRAYEALDIPDSAVAAYRQALAEDKSRQDVRRSLVSLYEQTGNTDALYNLIQSSIDSQVDLPFFTDYLLNLLSGASLSTDRAAPALRMLVQTYIVANLTPESFTTDARDRLAQVEKTHPELASAISALLTAFTPLSASERFAPADPSWWLAQPDRAQTWSTLLSGLADHYRWSKRCEEAASLYEAAVRAEAAASEVNNIYLKSGLIECYGNLQRLAAIDSLLRGHERPDNTGKNERLALRNAFFMAGDIYMRTDARTGLKYFLTTVDFDEKYVPALVNIGYLYERLEDVKSGIPYLERAVKLDPTNNMARNNLGDTQFLYGQFSDALDNFKQSYQLEPTLIAALNTGLAYRFSGDLANARTWHALAVQRSDSVAESDETFWGGPWVYTFTPLFKGDTVTINRHIEVNTPNQKRALTRFALGLDLALSGQSAEAESAFSAALARADVPEYRCFYVAEIRSALAFINVTSSIRSQLNQKIAAFTQQLDCSR